MSFNADIILGYIHSFSSNFRNTALLCSSSALLVGTWANSVLYTVEIIQLLVSSTIAIDSVSMIANYASVYLYTITHWALPTLPLYDWLSGRFGPSLPGWEILASVRIYHCSIEARLLTRSRTRNKFITLALFFFITVAIGGAFACAVTIAIFPGYSDRRRVMIPATTWLITEAVTDISIALALLLQFRMVKSSFKETRGLLDKLAAHTIQTGAAGATIALAVLIAFLANNESNGGFLDPPLSIPGSHIPVPTGIAYCLGRVYCLTMVRTPKKICVGGISQNLKLASLNRRKTGNTWSSKGTLSGASPETQGERGIQERSEGGDEYGGIRGFLPGPSRRSSRVAIEMKVNDSDLYSSNKKQDLFNE
ncbi:hypothetical protein B0H14DRAFT_2636427 [Mycena olivaceomarginata]|nr:hypothetical protein B0H14DRAFT_2636427 [Mycena olivaceomarginata]